MSYKTGTTLFGGKRKWKQQTKTRQLNKPADINCNKLHDGMLYDEAVDGLCVCVCFRKHKRVNGFGNNFFLIQPPTPRSRFDCKYYENLLSSSS